MLEKTYRYILNKSDTRAAPWWLAAVAFAESSVFPLPPDILLIPMILARRDRWLFLCLLASASSVLGGLLGYAIGYFLFETIGVWVINFYGLEESFHTFKEMFHEWGTWILLLKGATPVPYKLLTITAGAVELPLLTFVLASLASRLMRFLVVGVLLFYFGPPIQTFIEKRLGVVSALVLVLTIGGIAMVKLL
ncbi:YqaA family protein [Pararhodospirillum photometricum]|uniref:DedA family protein n=1 Tax=Pararhodospirillum photometricum DSM 122 TaxID=1150469 RepID=H6SRI9_PARPM|nr:YqaA family protein [Pararhodospirillum photometricum]CCG07518.1 DedA family gene [Pararhodospirillum photometricum DSM 122]